MQFSCSNSALIKAADKKKDEKIIWPLYLNNVYVITPFILIIIMNILHMAQMRKNKNAASKCISTHCVTTLVSFTQEMRLKASVRYN